MARTHMHTHAGKTTVKHTLTHSFPAPSWLFLAVYWAIFRPLPVSSHLAGRDQANTKELDWGREHM